MKRLLILLIGIVLFTGCTDAVMGIPSQATYHDAISQDLIVGTKSWMKIGYNAAIGTSFETMWPTSTMYTFPTTSMKMQVVSSSAQDTNTTGTGIWQVKLWYLDSSYIEKSATINMNGTTSENTTVSDVYRIQYLRAYSTGSTNAAVGTITLRDADNPANVYDTISPGETRSRCCVFTVPDGYTLYVCTVMCSSGSGNQQASVRFTTRATYDNKDNRALTFFMAYTEILLQDHAVVLNLPVPTRLPEKTDIKVDAISDVAGAKGTVSLRGYLKQN